MQRIPVAGPSITQLECDYVTDAVRNGWYERAGEYPVRFERAFAEYVGVKHAVALPSCTSALHLALLALEVGPGDEVIVPDVTWIATSAPIDYVGATVVFADVDPDTWCLSPESVAARMTERTRAIIPVDLYGGVPDYAALRAVARAANVPIVEDAAEAVGAEYGGTRAGALGDIGVFSFHGSKTLTTGEGGMLVTDRDDVWGRVTLLRDHGRLAADPPFWNREVAYKYRMSSLQAALGLAQIQRAAELTAKKREAFRWYREALRDVDGLRWNAEPEGTRNSYWMTTVVVDPRLGLDKAALAASLGREGIDTRPFFHPLSSLPAYASRPEAIAARERNHVAYRVSPYGLNLPSSAALTRDDVQRVADALKDALRER